VNHAAERAEALLRWDEAKLALAAARDSEPAAG